MKGKRIDVRIRKQVLVDVAKPLTDFIDSLQKYTENGDELLFIMDMMRRSLFESMGHSQYDELGEVTITTNDGREKPIDLGRALDTVSERHVDRTMWSALAEEWPESLR